MLENGKLDNRPAIVPERLEMPVVSDMVAGSAYLVDKDALWFEENGEIWINRFAPLEYGEDDYVSQFVRIVKFEQGIVVDWTTTRDEDGNLEKVYKNSFEEHVDNENYSIGDYEKVIGFITTETELKQIKKMLKQDFNITLAGRMVTQKATKKPRETKKKSKARISKSSR